MSAGQVQKVQRQLSETVNQAKSAALYHFGEGLAALFSPTERDLLVTFFGRLWALRGGRLENAGVLRAQSLNHCFAAAAAEQLDSAAAALRAALSPALREVAVAVLARMWRDSVGRLPAARRPEARGQVFDEEVARLF